jgi:hypothetical protein
VLFVWLFIARGAELVPLELHFETNKPILLRVEAPRAGAPLRLRSGHYRLGWEGEEITFYRASDMLEIGRLHAPTRVLDAPKKTGATLTIKKEKVTLTLVMGTQTTELRGALAAAEPPAPVHESLVGLDESSAASLPSDLPGSDDPFTNSWLRLKGQVQHCSDHAQRFSWGPSDPRYVRCVCPIAQDFRMPRQAAEKRFRLDAHTQVTLTNDATGKVLACTLTP